jgi:DEAD/DEAH box helicase domain-containing protein
MLLVNCVVKNLHVDLSRDMLISSGFRILHEEFSEGVAPLLCGKRFRDFLGDFVNALPIADVEMYTHQCATAETLLFGRNVILTAGTGSGKTEAWAIPALITGFKTLVIYPNKALVNDQVRRLRTYAKQLTDAGIPRSVGEIHADADELDMENSVVITNPAYLMTVIKSRRGKLAKYLGALDLVVIDEFAFYTLTQQQFLLEMLRIISREYSHPRIAILTATLGGVNELKSELESINGKDAKVIEGAPFRRRNITYVADGGDFIGYITRLLMRGEDAVTIIFTETINTAEKIRRKVKARCDDCPIATHHSRLSRDRRIKVEEGLRNGSIKVVVSPRTLEQGIDIGMVARVIHYGLPKEPMTYIQREGRKGRRLEIPFTETVIIPVKDMDKEIINEGLSEWVSIGPSSYMRVSSNKYLELFRALYETFRHGNDYGLLTFNLDRKQARSVWRNIQFYNYGLSQYVLYVNGVPIDVSVSKRDVVEYYQPGNIDLVNSSIAIDIVGNKVREVSIDRVREIAKGIPWLSSALNRYIKIKYSIGEKPSIEEDLEKGRLEGRVLVNAYVPNGFGMLREWPDGVMWVVEHQFSLNEYEEPIKIMIHDAPLVGSYRYYTYGYEVPISGDKAVINQAAVTMLFATIRITHGINTQHLMGFATTDTVKIWEREPAGVLQSLDYSKIAEYLLTTSYTDKKLRLATAVIDEYTYRIIKNHETFEAIRDKALELVRELKYITKHYSSRVEKA